MNTQLNPFQAIGMAFITVGCIMFTVIVIDALMQKRVAKQYRCHCGLPSVHTEFSPFMDDYCNNCTYARCDISAASDCPMLYKNKRQ